MRKRKEVDTRHLLLALAEEISQLDEDTDDKAKNDQKNDQIKPFDDGSTDCTKTVDDDWLQVRLHVCFCISHVVTP